VAWVQAGIDMFKIYADVFTNVYSAVFQTVFAFINLLINMWDDPEVAFKAFIHELGLIWDEFFTWFAKTFPNITTAIATFIGDILGFWTQLWLDISTGFMDLQNTIFNWAKDTALGMMEPFKPVIGFLTDTFGKNKNIKGALTVKGVQEVANTGSIGSRIGAGVRAGAGISKIDNSSSVKVDVNVNAAPGASAEAISRKLEQGIPRAIDDALKRQNRNAMKAFVPAAGGA
jgi:hypothetical protein